MRFIRTLRLAKFVFAFLGALCVFTSALSGQTQSKPVTEDKNQACPGDDSGLKLPLGFCATIFADDVGHARRLSRQREATRSGLAFLISPDHTTLHQGLRPRSTLSI